MEKIDKLISSEKGRQLFKDGAGKAEMMAPARMAGVEVPDEARFVRYGTVKPTPAAAGR